MRKWQWVVLAVGVLFIAYAFFFGPPILSALVRSAMYWTNAILIILLPLALFHRLKASRARWSLGASMFLVLIHEVIFATLRVSYQSDAIFTLSRGAWLLSTALIIASVLFWWETPRASPKGPVAARPGRRRSFWKVLILSAITFSVYYWVYLFRSIREMSGAPHAGEQRQITKDARAWLLLHLILSIVIPALGALLHVFWLLERGRWSTRWPQEVAHVYSRSSVVAVVVFVVFWSHYVRLVRATGDALKRPRPVNRALWVLLGLVAAVNVATAVSLLWRLRPSTLLSFLPMPLFFVFLYLVVRDTNSLWGDERPREAAKKKRPELEDRLRELQLLREKGLVSEEEFSAKRQALLDEL